METEDSLALADQKLVGCILDSIHEDQNGIVDQTKNLFSSQGLINERSSIEKDYTERLFDPKVTEAEN